MVIYPIDGSQSAFCTMYEPVSAIDSPVFILCMHLVCMHGFTCNSYLEDRFSTRQKENAYVHAFTEFL